MMAVGRNGVISSVRRSHATKERMAVGNRQPSETDGYKRFLIIVTSKNNKTHFESRTRQPRPYELSFVTGKVST